MKLAKEKIDSLLKDKELILHEVHHRIKNNLDTVKSLLSLHADSIEDETAISALRDAESRVHSMVALYNKLYDAIDCNEISMKNYIPLLVDEIVSNFNKSSKVTIEDNIGDFVLSTTKLQSLGLIINELITNIMKYAFLNQSEGKIILYASEKNNIITLIIEDNGSGMPESIDFKNSKGFGLTIVNMLANQLHGTLRIDREKED
jgi:two-component sensor histidine kinase